MNNCFRNLNPGDTINFNGYKYVVKRIDMSMGRAWTMHPKFTYEETHFSEENFSDLRNNITITKKTQ